MMNVPYVDLASQYQNHRREILDIVDRVLSRGQYILGDEVEKFERSFATLLGCRNAVSVANGTDSLILAMKALGIGPEDEVITAPNSWISSASSIALTGARPVFVDVLPDQTMDPKEVEKAFTKKTKAIMPVHLTGKCADMNPILELSRIKKIPVIEDAAQSVGSKYFGRHAGTMGTIGSFSLHPLKNLNACGDAGILVTDDDRLAEKLRLLKNHGLVDRNTVSQWGYNSRLDTLQAAILNYRLGLLESIIDKRRNNAKFYRAELGHKIECPIDNDQCFDVYHLFVIQVEKRNELKDFLATRGIQTAIHYPVPIHLQPAAKYLGYSRGIFPNVEKQSESILSLPIHQDLTHEQLRFVASTILEFYG